jgi:Mor family transcriptional regulator
MTSPHNRFFTWVAEPFADPAQVAERIRAHMRVLWFNGARVEELAKTFKMPAEWVDEFIRRTEHLQPNQGEYS